jgi:hypothetical protein
MTTKYKLNLKQAIVIGLIAAAGLTGCKKNLNVNQNPNNPSGATTVLLLPTTEAAVSQVIGNAFQIYGNMWAQFWTQSPNSSQYQTIDEYNSSSSDFDRPFLNLYRVTLVNADLIIKSNESQSENTKGIAYLMKAYTYQIATDAFGDVPLAQALQGTNILNPKYDAQQVVYDSIFVYIDKALPLLKSTSAISPGNQDLIFQGNMTKWVAFANTLKLRAYLRLSKASPAVAQAGIQALYASNAAFLTQDASIQYTTTGGNENPLYNEMASPVLGKVQNVVASSTAVNAFVANNDPRLAKFYDLVVPSATKLVSIPQGSFKTFVGKTVSPPSPLVGGRANNPASAVAPVKLLSAAESYFLQAEAVARGWTNGNGSLTALYQQGIATSFTATGAGDPTVYTNTAPAALRALNAAVTVNDKVGAIITQKYFAMCGFQGFEAWTEWRRTGFPTFFVPSAASTIGAGKMPMRMLYSNEEAVTNSSFPGVIPIDIPVWWVK